MADKILNSFDFWIGAQGWKSKLRLKSVDNISLEGIARLRELIIELAVRGKLATQDPKDEPANKLIEKITKEKERLIEEGKIKEQKRLPKVSDEEKTFVLPNGWEFIRLGDVSEINPRNEEIEDELEASFVPMSMVSTSYSGKHESEIRIWSEIKKGFTHFANGDIGIAKITPCFENSKAIILSGLKNGVGAGTTELLIARPYGALVNSRYILLNLKSPWYLKLGESKMTGTAGQKRVPRNFFEQNPLPLPPLAEQYRIVAKVDELMALCDELEQQETNHLKSHQLLVETLLGTLTQAKDAAEFQTAWTTLAQHFDDLFITEDSIDQLKQIILQLAVMGKLVKQDPKDEPASDLLEKIVKEKERLVADKKMKLQRLGLDELNDEERKFISPIGWEWCRLQSLVFLLGDGLHGTPNYTGGTNYYFVNGNNLKNGKIEIFPDTKTVSKDELIKHKKELTLNTVLVSINGTLGNVAFYNSEEIMLGKSACYFNLSQNVYKEFIRKVIESDYFKEYALENATGTTIKNLGLKAMNEFPICLPPFNEQKQIVAKVDELFAVCDSLKERIGESQKVVNLMAEAVLEQVV